MCFKDEFLCIIHEKMDRVKTILPRFQVTNKMIFGLGKLPITLINMITHGHSNEIYAQYVNELWPNDPNSTLGSLLQKKLQFVNSKSCLSTLYKKYILGTSLARKSCCTYELKTPSQTIGPKLCQKLITSNE